MSRHRSLRTVPGTPGLLLPDTGSATPWTGLERMPSRPADFSFVVLSDRTGLARPGVFERGIAVTNALRPDFAIQLGDQIEGYSVDVDVVEAMWNEFDAITDALEVPLFRITGNHDVSNDLMREQWLRRFGALHYHFVHRDVLFVMVDTQDPPQQLSDFVTRASPDDAEAGVDPPRELDADGDREALQRRLEALTDWDGRMPGNISEQQFGWLQQALDDHTDARWTIVCMHMPIWQDETHEGYRRLKSLLGARPYTMLAGHVHNYRHQTIDGREHIRLGPTGGAWVKSGDDGNFDHVMWVTMTPKGPEIANIVLDGVLGATGGEFRITPRFPAPVDA